MTQKTTCPICSRYATQPPAVLALAHEVAVESYGHAGTYAGQGMLGIEDVQTRTLFSELARENFGTMQTIRACPASRPPADPPATLEEEIAAARRDPEKSAAMDRARAEMAAVTFERNEIAIWKPFKDRPRVLVRVIAPSGDDYTVMAVGYAASNTARAGDLEKLENADVWGCSDDSEAALTARVFELEAALAAATDPEAVDLEALDKAALLLSDQSNGIFATLPDAYRKAAERLRVLRAALAAPHPAPTLTDLMADIDEAEKRGDTNFIFHAAARQLLPGQRLLLTALDRDGGFKLEEAPQAVGAVPIAEIEVVWHRQQAEGAGSVARAPEEWLSDYVKRLQEKEDRAYQKALTVTDGAYYHGAEKAYRDAIEILKDALSRRAPGAPLAALTGGAKEYPSDEEIIRDTDAAMVRPGFGKGRK